MRLLATVAAEKFTMMFKQISAGVLCLGFLSACAVPLDQGMVQSAEYQQGYVHGCTTATQQTNGVQADIVEDKSMMGTDQAYTSGWRQGFYGCGGNQIDTRGYSNDAWYTDIGD